MATHSSTTTSRSTARTKAGSSKTAISKGKSIDAIALLKADHRAVEALFKEFESARKASRKQQIVQSICDELTVHAELEEKSFYPIVRDALKEEDDLLDEAEVEHSSLKWLIEQLRSAKPDSDHYDAKVTVLKEYVQHHVKEEEKSLFPKVKKSALDTVELGATLQANQKNLKTKLLH